MFYFHQQTLNSSEASKQVKGKKGAEQMSLALQPGQIRVICPGWFKHQPWMNVLFNSVFMCCCYIWVELQEPIKRFSVFFFLNASSKLSLEIHHLQTGFISNELLINSWLTWIWVKLRRLPLLILSWNMIKFQVTSWCLRHAPFQTVEKSTLEDWPDLFTMSVLPVRLRLCLSQAITCNNTVISMLIVPSVL